MLDNLLQGFANKKTANSVVIYTAIFGGKDNLIEPRQPIPGVDLVCFTDNSNMKSKAWEIRYMPKFYENDNLNAKVYKVVPHYFLPEYKKSLWIDGRVLLRTRNIYHYINEVLSKHDWAMYKHIPGRSVAEEAETCIEWKLAEPELVTKQIETYRKDGFDLNTTISAGTIIFRNQLDKQVIKIGEAWWDEIRHHSRRDQLSFPYVVWKYKFSPYLIDENVYKNDYFWVIKHADHPKYSQFVDVLKIKQQ